MLDFSVIGLGSVGWAVINGLHSRGLSYTGYDIKGHYDWNSVLETKVAFICTSTPSNGNGHLDASSVHHVLGRLNASKYHGLIVVKSTIPIGFMEKVAQEFPDLHLVYMPEFLREKSSFTWFVKPDRVVAAGKNSDVKEVLDFFKWVEGADIIRTDYRSAEIGKLAHNAYIATKVSFTNEMEEISQKFNGNSSDVMRIVWTDRRVRCSEHLTPGLGPYGGKCVLKDVNELIEHSSSKLISTVREVNNRCTIPEMKTDYGEVHVIIPSHHSPSFLDRALESVSHQSHLPSSVIVITDPDTDRLHEIKEVVEKLSLSLPLRHITNERTKSVSGAINAGLHFLGMNPSFNSRAFIALLDDDDWWERRYLENCLKYAHETDADWIISGLIRYDEKHPEGLKQTIPRSVNLSDLLVGNPNIQNSNLFVRADPLQAIGGYDEDLVSTTDRDTCIRLLQGETKYAVLFNHLVHHDAFTRDDRLSHPGSPRKKAGLRTFYKKYHDLMTPEQRIAFEDRALDLFAVDLRGGSE
jgi:UDPglucose 6-dehydrogenase